MRDSYRIVEKYLASIGFKPIRDEKWVYARCLNPNMLVLGCAPELKFTGDAGHVMPTMGVHPIRRTPCMDLSFLP